jgi:hypothetical protein
LISQAIVNLVSNAIIHNRPGGSVQVAVRRNADLAMVRAEDNGPASQRNICPVSSSDFIGLTKRAFGAMAAPAWDWRLPRASRKYTAARSPSKAN